MDPYAIESKEELRSVITDGSDFWGDHILLQLLQKKLEVNIIILNSDNNIESQNIDERFTIHPIASHDLSKYEKTTVIYYLDQFHFQLIGYFNGNRMVSIFKTDEIPKVL